MLCSTSSNPIPPHTLGAQVCGIILGMLALGFSADIIGRKWGSRLASSVMLLGGALLTGCAGSDSQFLAMFLASLFIMGAGGSRVH